MLIDSGSLNNFLDHRGGAYSKRGAYLEGRFYTFETMTSVNYLTVFLRSLIISCNFNKHNVHDLKRLPQFCQMDTAFQSKAA